MAKVNHMHQIGVLDLGNMMHFTGSEVLVQLFRGKELEKFQRIEIARTNILDLIHICPGTGSKCFQYPISVVYKHHQLPERDFSLI